RPRQKIRTVSRDQDRCCYAYKSERLDEPDSNCPATLNTVFAVKLAHQLLHEGLVVTVFWYGFFRMFRHGLPKNATCLEILTTAEHCEIRHAARKWPREFNLLVPSLFSSKNIVQPMESENDVPN